MRLMVIEAKHDILIEERYENTVMTSSASLVHWDTIEVSPKDYYRYEALRIALDVLTWEIKDKARA